MNLEALTQQLQKNPPKTLAVAAAQDDAVLKAVAQASALGIARPILCGEERAIRAAANAAGVDISDFPILNAGDTREAAALAVGLVRGKKADMLMKGILQTADLLRAVLNKETGLRGDGILSHVAIIYSPLQGRTLYLTDCAMVTYPDLKTKVELIKNAVKVARSLGVDCPRVAVLAAVELVNPDMPATLDAAQLAMMSRRGQIRDCVVDGPLALDLALSPESVRHKGVQSEVAGKADILLFHNIEAANSTSKAMTVVAGCTMGGVIMGAAAPVVLTSRADTDQSKLYSIACAAACGQG